MNRKTKLVAAHFFLRRLRLHSGCASFVSRGVNVKEVIATERGPKAIGPYSQAIKANGFVFVSGQVPLDPRTQQLVEGDVARQTERVLENGR